MATESTTNGNYGAPQASTSTGQPGAAHPSNHATHGTNGANDSHAATDGAGVSKDEVAWYFVEQYYTTMSRSPDKLHLFYSKRSQFVSGVEAEKVSVSVGQRAINDRIKQLDIQDCKVRVSNVDSQESFKNIVVQVIGEMSNKSAPHRKFVQTFILAEQPNGYFVSNDIFRYIADDDDDEVEHEMPAELEAQEQASIEPPAVMPVGQAPARGMDAQAVDRKLAAALAEPTAVASDTDADASNKTEPSAADADASNEDGDGGQDTPDESPEHTELDTHEPEAPKDPAPTPAVPAVTPAKVEPPASTPAVPAKPAAPKTWASIANRANSTKPAAAAVSSTPSAPTLTKATQPASTSSVGSSTTTTDTSAPAPPPTDSEWQTAGPDHTKKQNRQAAGSISNGSGDKGNVLGYVKNVTEKVDASLLRTTLSHFGKLAYFDISRAKNCAFVEFSDTAGYNAAVAANPHNVGGEQIFVEERRPRATAYGGNFSTRGGLRGGRGNAENRAPSQGRGGAGFVKDAGRGGFVPRGNRGGMASRGRGMPQPA